MKKKQHYLISRAHYILISVQTLICIAPNPRMCGDGYLDNEGTRSGLAVSSAYPTHSQTFLSRPTLPVSTDREDALV